MWDCYKDRFKLQEVGDNFQMLQGGSVTSVNGKVGAVVLTAEDVGALPDTYEAPVTSVNTQTGDVVLDAGDIAYESTTVESELGTINSALTSLSSVTEIIDTASGAIASFPDGSGLPMRSLVAQINPVQAGTGDPSPDNIRPISGHTGLSVEVRWKNLFEPLSDTYYKVESGESFNGYNITSLVAFLNTLPVGDYIVSFKFNVLETVSGATTWGILLRNSVTGYIDGRQTGQHNSGETLTFTRSITITEANKGQFANAYLYSGGGNRAKVYWYDFQLELGSTATAYEPYTSGTTTTVSWQSEAGTVYGGSDEIVGGELTVNKAGATFDGSDMTGIEMQGTAVSGKYRLFIRPERVPGNSSPSASSAIPDVITNIYPAGSADSTYLTTATCIASRFGGFYIYDANLQTIEAWTASLQSTPLTIVYPLTTPQTYTHAPTQISTLLGQNNVWHDANGDTTVIYQASIKGYIDKVLGQ